MDLLNTGLKQLKQRPFKAFSTQIETNDTVTICQLSYCGSQCQTHYVKLTFLLCVCVSTFFMFSTNNIDSAKLENFAFLDV